MNLKRENDMKNFTTAYQSDNLMLIAHFGW